MKFAASVLLFLSASAFAGDPDLDYILQAVRTTPCSQVQVVIAKNIGVIRWDAGSMRYLYGDDIAPLRAAVVDSSKLPIDVDQAFEIPDMNDPNWPAAEDALVAELDRLFTLDRQEHPADHCGASVVSEESESADGFFVATETVIPKLAQVTPEIYRGGRPDAQGLTGLASKGIKTIIDLEDDSAAMRVEQQNAARLGMGWISESMSASVTPNDREVTQILSLLQDASRQPIFIHCLHGEDRTGLIVGLYRVLVQKWAPAKAYQEMLQMGFHPQYKPLDQYFRAKTGYTGR